MVAGKAAVADRADQPRLPSVTAPIAGRIGRRAGHRGALVGRGRGRRSCRGAADRSGSTSTSRRAPTRRCSLRAAIASGFQSAGRRAGSVAVSLVLPTTAASHGCAASCCSPTTLGRPRQRPDRAARAEVPNLGGRAAAGPGVRVRLEQAPAVLGIMLRSRRCSAAQGDSVMVVGADGKVAPRPVKVGPGPGRPLGGDSKAHGRRAGGGRRFPEDPAERAGEVAVPGSRQVRCGQRPRQRQVGPPRAEEPPSMAQFFIDRPIFAWVIALFVWSSARSRSRSCRWRGPAGGVPSIVVNVSPGAPRADAGRQRDRRDRARMNGAPAHLHSSRWRRPTAAATSR